MWEAISRELRHALRTLLRHPVFSGSVILTLALGIACNAIVFSTLNAVLLRPLPYKDPDRILTIWNKYGKTEPTRSFVSVPDYFDRVEQSKTLESVAVFQRFSFDYTGGDEPQRLRGALVTASFFPLLGTQPQLGRFPTIGEEMAGQNQVVVISHGLWQQQFGSNPAILERPLQLNGLRYTVIGVMPASFRFPDTEVQVWSPIVFTPEQKTDSERGNESLEMIGRMKKGVTVQEATAEMEMIAARVPENVPQRREFLLNSGWGAIVMPLREFYSAEIRPALLVLMGAVLFLLLVVCSNVAHLMLVFLSGRRKDLAIRTALGANSWQLLRGHFLESLILTVTGAAIGLIATRWTLLALQRILPMDLSNFGGTRIDVSVLAFVGVLTLLLAATLSLLSAREFRSKNLQTAVRETSSGVTEKSTRHYVLIAAEVALSLLLVTCATLLMKSFLQIVQESPGFQTGERFTIALSLPRSRYPEREHRAQFYAQLMEKVRAISGVRAAGASGSLPLAGENWTATFAVEGYQPPPGGTNPGFEYRPVTPGYFRAMGIPLLRGRDFDTRDTREAGLVVVVDERLAARFWPGQNPIGKRLGFSDTEVEWREVVGLVGTVKNTGVTLPSQEQVYFPHAQMAVSSLFLVVQASGEPRTVLPAIRSVVSQMDRSLPIDRIRTMDDVLSQSVARPRFQTWMLGFFAVISLLLAVVGIYGVTAYSVRRQTREIGIRIALGATRRHVTSEVLSRGLKATLFGILIGTAAALALSRVLSSFLFRVRANDPFVLAASAIVMLTVALLACYIPARRASKVDPMNALRYD